MQPEGQIEWIPNDCSGSFAPKSKDPRTPHIVKVPRPALRISLGHFPKSLGNKNPLVNWAGWKITIFNLGNTSSFRIHFPLLGYLFFRSGDFSEWAEWCWNAKQIFYPSTSIHLFKDFLFWATCLLSQKGTWDASRIMGKMVGGFPWNGVFPLHNQPHIHLIGHGYFLDPNPLFKGLRMAGGLIPRDFPTMFSKEISGSSVRIPFSKYLVSPIYEPFVFFAMKGSLRNPTKTYELIPKKTTYSSVMGFFQGKKGSTPPSCFEAKKTWAMIPTTRHPY